MCNLRKETATFFWHPLYLNKMHVRKTSISRIYYSFFKKRLGTLVYKKVAFQMEEIIQQMILGQLDSHSEKSDVGALNHILLHGK